MGYCLPFGQEMLKVRGYQVVPAELEGCILGHPDVSDTCVVGIPDEYSGELPLPFVVLRADASQRTRSDPSTAEAVKRSIRASSRVLFARLLSRLYPGWNRLELAQMMLCM